MTPLRVGDTLYGYCAGYFGRDFWGPATVEAIGTDWVVIRSDLWRGEPYFYEGSPETLIEFTTEIDDR